MKARTPTRGTHPFPSKSISSQSIPDSPSLLSLNKVFSTQSLLILQGKRFRFWGKTSKKLKGRGALR